MEFNKIRLWAEPRPFAKAASLRKAKAGTSSAQLTTDKHGGCKSCSPCPARSTREFSQDHTESSSRGSVSLPETQLLEMPEDDIPGERISDLQAERGVCFSDLVKSSCNHHPGRVEVQGERRGREQKFTEGRYFSNQIPWVETWYLGHSLRLLELERM